MASMDGKVICLFSPLGSLGQSEHMSDQRFFFFFFFPFFPFRFYFSTSFSIWGTLDTWPVLGLLGTESQRGQPRHHSRQSRHCPGGTPTVSELFDQDRYHVQRTSPRLGSTRAKEEYPADFSAMGSSYISAS